MRSTNVVANLAASALEHPVWTAACALEAGVPQHLVAPARDLSLFHLQWQAELPPSDPLRLVGPPSQRDIMSFLEDVQALWLCGEAALAMTAALPPFGPHPTPFQGIVHQLLRRWAPQLE